MRPVTWLAWQRRIDLFPLCVVTHKGVISEFAFLPKQVQNPQASFSFSRHTLHVQLLFDTPSCISFAVADFDADIIRDEHQACDKRQVRSQHEASGCFWPHKKKVGGNCAYTTNNREDVEISLKNLKKHRFGLNSYNLSHGGELLEDPVIRKAHQQQPTAARESCPSKEGLILWRTKMVRTDTISFPLLHTMQSV